MLPKLLIFDFDGVLADSEEIACSTAAAYASKLGSAISPDEGLTLFMGKRVEDVAQIISERGGVVPPNFASELLKMTMRAFESHLKPVLGAKEFLESHATFPRCIASSSSHTRLTESLKLIGLTNWFDGRIFSVEDVARGKPFPDLFLFAAKSMNSEPADVLVIEDSIGGVKAAVAANMRVVGLLAASHTRAGSEARLLEAGATKIARSYRELSQWIGDLSRAY